jgi:tetratricopeptide (TPR) repeat protein
MENSNDNLKELQKKALGYVKRGNHDRAIALYLGILEKYKDSDHLRQLVYSNLGVIYLNLEKLDMAEDYLKKALSYSPLHPEYHHMLGIVFLQSHRPKEAVEELNICLKQKPDNEEYLRVSAVALHDAGKEIEAVQALGRIPSLAPQAAELLAAEAGDCLFDGHLKKARKLAEQAKIIDPTNALAKKVINLVQKKQLENTATKAHALDSPFSIFQIKMKLKGISPPIWRRFQVSGNISLYKLHLVLQSVMDWRNYHLFEFKISEIRFGIPDLEDYYETRDARRYKLNKVVSSEKTKFLYTYDFGDGWEHELTIEKIIPAEQELKHTVCLGGKRAGPLEDSGGIGGYENYLEILRTPPPADPDDEDEEIKSSREWMGADYDPEYFDLAEINRELKKIR